MPQYIVIQDYVDGGTIGQQAAYGPFSDMKKATEFAQKNLTFGSKIGIIRLEDPKDYE